MRIRGKHDDIDLIGRTTRHLTFFEMLGNFSFGDYFKERAIPLAWEFLTGSLGLDGDRLWISVFFDDDEAAEIWADQVGVPAGASSAWATTTSGRWARPAPAVPVRRSTTTGARSWGPEGGPAGGGGEERYVELWNLVFMQYDRQADADPGPPPEAQHRHRCRARAGPHDRSGCRPPSGRPTLLRPIIARAEALTGRTYGEDDEVDVALRILADHARSLSFLISDGVFPSNEDRGYVLRRLIRRAVRQAYRSAWSGPSRPTLVSAVVGVMGDAYPDLARNEEFVIGVAAREEGSFRATLRTGLTILEAELSEAKRDRLGSGGLPAA